MPIGAFASPYIGLLGPEEQAALRRNALLQGALGLLEASGPSRTPVSMGQALARGAQQGLGAADQYAKGAIEAGEVKEKRGERAGKRAFVAGLKPGMTLPEIGGLAQQQPGTEDIAIGAFMPPKAPEDYNLGENQVRLSGTTNREIARGPAKQEKIETSRVTLRPPNAKDETADRTFYADDPEARRLMAQNWREVRTPAAQVNIANEPRVGALKPGEMLEDDPTVPGGKRIVTIPGGEAARQAEERGRGEMARAQDAYLRNTITYQSIEKAIDQAGLLSAGVAAPTAIVGGTPAANLAATLSTIQANIGLDQLNRMRQAAPGGASGLGQVTEREHALLQAVLGDIRQSQSPGQLKENLGRLQTIYQAIITLGIPEVPNSLNPVPVGILDGNKLVFEDRTTKQRFVLER